MELHLRINSFIKTWRFVLAYVKYISIPRYCSSPSILSAVEFLCDTLCRLAAKEMPGFFNIGIGVVVVVTLKFAKFFLMWRVAIFSIGLWVVVVVISIIGECSAMNGVAPYN